jgi:hypothetical protein
MSGAVYSVLLSQGGACSSLRLHAQWCVQGEAEKRAIIKTIINSSNIFTKL